MSIEKDKSQIALIFVTTVLLIANILLVFQNLNLRAQLESLEPPQVKQGDVLGSFQAKNLKGDEVKIDYSHNSKKILLFFRTTCGYCQKQMTYWKNLVSNADSQVYTITAITTETDTQAIESYIKNYQIENWEVLIIDTAEAEKAKLLATPVTIVVDDKGVVEKVWTGMWQTNDINSAGKYFALNFSDSK